MDPVRLATAALRAQLPDLILRPGMSLVARVAERTGQHGILMLAGAPLVAELPEQVRAGDRLALTVQEATPERVVLRLAEERAPMAPPPAVPVPLPDGRSARVSVEERRRSGAGAGERHELTLAWESERLGRLEVRLTLEPGAMLATVAAPAAASDELAGEAAALRDALAAATRRPAQVRVDPRRDPVDLYA